MVVGIAAAAVTETLEYDASYFAEVSYDSSVGIAEIAGTASAPAGHACVVGWVVYVDEQENGAQLLYMN